MIETIAEMVIASLLVDPLKKIGRKLIQERQKHPLSIGVASGDLYNRSEINGGRRDRGGREAPVGWWED